MSQGIATVNDIKSMILAAQDRSMRIVYEDFGNKNQRIVRLVYTANSVPGYTLNKDITYTLVDNKYRRDEIIWSIT